MKLCRYCLQGIEAHEGHQRKELLIYTEDYDENQEEVKCDWCDEMFAADELYVI